MNEIYTYAVFDLVFQLPFACPVLPLAPPGAVPDVIVTEGPVSRTLDGPVIQQDNWQATAGQFLLRAGRHTGRFLAEAGCRVTFERPPEAQEARIGYHFLNKVIAAVLSQRGLLVLHASAAATPTGILAWCGASGEGKSTILAALVRRGYRMHTDDILALRMGRESGGITASPGIPHFHLTGESAARLRYATDGLPSHRWQRMKTSIPSAVAPAPGRLRALYKLHLADSAAVRREPLYGKEKMAAILNSLYGPVLPAEHARYFPVIAALAENTPVYRLTRPTNRWSIDDVLEVLLHG